METTTWTEAELEAQEHAAEQYVEWLHRHAPEPIADSAAELMAEHGVEAFVINHTIAHDPHSHQTGYTENCPGCELMHSVGKSVFD